MIPVPVADRAYDANDRLLYVGCTMGPLYRMKQHAYGSAWWPEMVRIEYGEWLPRREAMALEDQMIWDFGPIYNQPRVTDHHEFDRLTAITLPSGALRFRAEDVDALLAAPAPTERKVPA